MTPRALLRAEGLILALAAVTVYWAIEGPFWLFAAALLAPDLSLLGYLGGRRLGARMYNAAHTTAIPLLLGAGSLVLARRELGLATAIWLTHIGVDRALGLGLKYAGGWKQTHFDRV